MACDYLTDGIQCTHNNNTFMKTLLNVRIDQQLKITVQRLAEEMGMNLSTLTTILFTKVAQERKVEIKSKYTVNGFTPEFEEEVLKASETTDGDVVCETEEDIHNFFQQLKKA